MIAARPSAAAPLRRGVLTAALVGLALLSGACAKKKPVVTPPPADTRPTQPAAEVNPTPTPDTGGDLTERRPEKSLEDLQNDAYGNGLLGDVYFEFDRYDLDAAAKARLARNAEFAGSADGSALTFTLEGHCDERGTNEYNLALGQRRVSAALDYLGSLGVDRSRFKAISYGEERPYCTESNESCWQKNRRVHFVITGRSHG